MQRELTLDQGRVGRKNEGKILKAVLKLIDFTSFWLGDANRYISAGGAGIGNIILFSEWHILFLRI